MSERMKGFTCCGDCIYYSYKKHKCNLGASVETDARNPFYDDCPIPDVPSEQEIRNKAVDTFMIAIETLVKLYGAVSVIEIQEIAEQVKKERVADER